MTVHMLAINAAGLLILVYKFWYSMAIVDSKLRPDADEFYQTLSL